MKFDAEKLKGIWEKVKTAVGKVSKKIWIAAAVVIVVIAAAIAIFLNTRPYSILITGANADEVAYVVNWLEQRNVRTFRYQGTDTILVPEGQAFALKAALMTEMYRDGSSAFTGYMDNVSMLSTEKERSQNWYIALMEHFNAVIGSMEGVQSAEVTIAPGEDHSYVLDTGNVVAATASVKVTMRYGKTLDSGMAAAIRAYVANGVQGLKVESVEIIDSYGNRYNAGAVGTDGSEASQQKIQVEEFYENKLRKAAIDAITPFCGEGHVVVSVNVTAEVGNSTSFTHEPYIPEYVVGREDGQGIIGSWAWDWLYYASDDVIAGGIVGTGSNSDILTNVENQPTRGDTDGQLQGSGQKDYNNPYTDTQTERVAAYIKDCTVSVSLDSTTMSTPNMDELRMLVAHAVGITPVVTETMTAQEYLASKITIYYAPFYHANEILPPVSWWPFPEFVAPWMVYAAAAGLLLFVVVMTILLTLRGKKKKRLAAEEAERLQQQQSMDELLAAVGMTQLEPVGADVMSLQSEKSMELRQDIRQFAEENPEVAAQLIRTWLRGGEENG